MSDVYLAVDSMLDRQVAVKVLSEAFSEDDAFRERFLREARTAARLGPRRRVVTIYDVGEWKGRPFIVMELIEGGTLADRISAGVPDQSRALAWLAQTAEALDAAHAEGIVHRDVKPANLLLDEQDEVRIADLGLACPELAGTGLTPPGGLVGTAGYLAPERLAGALRRRRATGTPLPSSRASCSPASGRTAGGLLASSRQRPPVSSSGISPSIRASAFRRRSPSSRSSPVHSTTHPRPGCYPGDRATHRLAFSQRGGPVAACERCSSSRPALPSAPPVE